jgi:hypothetical protein
LNPADRCSLKPLRLPELPSDHPLSFKNLISFCKLTSDCANFVPITPIAINCRFAG